MDVTTAGYRIEHTGGRFIGARVFRLATSADADAYSEALARVVRDCGATHPVLCADHRPVVVYPQEVTDRLIVLFQRMNNTLERVAIIVSPSNATIYLQLSRLVTEAGFQNRRVFQDATKAVAHLAPALDEDDLGRARAFLSTNV